MIAPEQINQASVLSELSALFEQYEAALMCNDLATLDQLFWHSDLTVRFGVDENLYGITAIQAFRNTRNLDSVLRVLQRPIITCYGADCATTTTEFTRTDGQLGRQSQTWVRLSTGWRIVSAHVSVI